MAESTFALAPIERVALEMLREERPEGVAALSERLARVLDDLAQTYQGWVVSAIEAEDLLDRDLRHASSGRRADTQLRMQRD